MPQPPNWTPNLSQPQPGSDAALALGWTWPAARQACDDHKRGNFTLSWQLWTDMDSLPAIRAAKNRRLATLCGLPWEVTGPSRAPGRIETEAARDLWDRHVRRLLRSTLSDVIGEGFSVWQHPTAVNPSTMRREVITVERYPISQIRYTPTPFPDVWQPGRWIERYYAVQYGVGDSLGAVMFGAQSPDVGRIEVPDAARIHGLNGVWVRFIQLPRPGETDGHWTFVADPVGADQPHLNGAVTALDVPYVGGAILTRSMYALSKTLGRQGIYGKMPPETQVQGTDGGMSAEGKAMRRTVAGFGLSEAEAVIPHEAELDAVSLTAQTAGLFPEFSAVNVRDVELAILGHAGAMAKEDAQYQAKDGVERKIPQHLERADERTICSAFEALANLVAGENVSMPTRVFLLGHLPNAEDDERRAAEQERDLAEGKKWEAFWKAVDMERAQGFELLPNPEGQARLDHVAKTCGVTAPKIPSEGLPPPLVKLPKPTVPITGENAQELPDPANPPPLAPPSRAAPEAKHVAQPAAAT